MWKAAISLALSGAMVTSPALAGKDEQRRQGEPKWQQRQVQLNQPQRGQEMQRHRFDGKQGRFHGAQPRQATPRYQDRHERRGDNRQQWDKGERRQDRRGDNRQQWDRGDRHQGQGRHWQQGREHYRYSTPYRHERRGYHVKRPYDHYWHSNRHHYYVRRLPSLAVSFIIGGVTFYSAYDSYYRYYPSYGYYQVVDPTLIWPVGTVVQVLPPDASEYWVGNRRYWMCGGVYFMALRGGGFVVVNL